MNLQYDKNMNYDCTLILQKDQKAYIAAEREKERRKGMEDGVFLCPGWPKTWNLNSMSSSFSQNLVKSSDYMYYNVSN